MCKISYDFFKDIGLALVVYTLPIFVCFFTINDKTSRWITNVSIFVVEFLAGLVIIIDERNERIRNKKIEADQKQGNNHLPYHPDRVMIYSETEELQSSSA